MGQSIGLGADMTKIYSPLMIQDLDNRRFNRLTAPFIFESDVLARLGLKYRVEVPTGFVHDLESVPIFRGSSNRGGVTHDYLCRVDSNPVVSKAIAAAVYFEVMEHCYRLDSERRWYQEARDWGLRWIKWAAVYVSPGYFHKHKVMATALEIAGVECDPFVEAGKE